jgi:hypothetical protein
MAPCGYNLALYFSEEQDFPESNLLTADHVGKNRFPLCKLLQRGSGTPPNHSGAIYSAENPAPERNPGLKFTQTDASLKSST